MDYLRNGWVKILGWYKIIVIREKKFGDSFKKISPEVKNVVHSHFKRASNELSWF